ncbi:MAG: CAP domain-containing protein [Devosia sp.]|nr:CAP domain-containing protein [Devosia sp.]
MPSFIRRVRTASLRMAVAAALLAAIAACGETAGGLAPGLVASMDAPGASLDRATALSLINQFRRTTGAGTLADDASLDAQAQSLAQTYSKTGKPPGLPAGITGLRASAGYPTFAETFSGWRNSPADAAVLGDPKAQRAGLAAVYDANSAYGVYWILVLGG